MTILNSDCCKCPHFKTDPSLFYAVRSTVNTGETKWKLRTHGPSSGVSVLCADDTRLLHYDPPCNDYVLVNVKTGAIERKFSQGISPGTKQFWHIDDWVVFWDSSTSVYEAFDFNGDALWTRTITSGGSVVFGNYSNQFLFTDSGTRYAKDISGTETTWTLTAGSTDRLTTTSGHYELGSDNILRLYNPATALEYDVLSPDMTNIVAGSLYDLEPIGDNGVGIVFSEEDGLGGSRIIVLTAVGASVNRFEFATGTFTGPSSTNEFRFIDESNFVWLRFPFYVRHYTGETLNWGSNAPFTYTNGGTNYQGFAADSQRTVVFMDPGANLYVALDNSDGSEIAIATADTEYTYQIADSIYVRTPDMYLVAS